MVEIEQHIYTPCIYVYIIHTYIYMYIYIYTYNNYVGVNFAVLIYF